MRRVSFRRAFPALLGALLAGPGAALAAPRQEQPPAAPAASAAAPCEADAGFHRLDFWVGKWDVFANDEKVGTNVIERVLRGCAVIENWRDIEGGEGKSLFYYNKVTGEWKQVWVTDRGPLKEKKKIEEFPDGGVRFQGELPQPGGGTILDRTTLTPLGPDRVRQVIEQSRDGGKTWKSGYDLIYVRQK